MAQPLTVESAAAIQAFIQQVQVRAEGGNDVDEETLALRMLASESAEPSYNLSQIQPESGVGSVGPVTAGADGSDMFNLLTKLMMGDTKPPQEQVTAGVVPKPAPVVVAGPSSANRDAQAQYAALKDVHSMINLYSNIMQVQQNPDGFNITSETATALAFQAKMAYNAIMGPCAGFYNFSRSEVQKYQNTISRDQLHAGFLGKVFKGFGFDQATMNALDTMLTTFVSAIKGINTGSSDPSTYDFCQILGLCPKFNITGNDLDPVWVYSPNTSLLYMKIDPTSFRQSLDKSVDSVDFKFELTVTKCELRVDNFERNRDRFDKMFSITTGHNLREYSNLLNKQIDSSSEPTGK
ncbi:hypothetical protein VTL71DRAFT_12144 [Oculimacula yallundae]|uniref:Uncharacterized protein n=1 Tax=Oculimacula yallundae TaxID=86028 RepID=A0ABR4CTQ0_9HELO